MSIVHEINLTLGGWGLSEIFQILAAVGTAVMTLGFSPPLAFYVKIWDPDFQPVKNSSYIGPINRLTRQFGRG